nr:unnamed protein product [Digitaria exilis]
MADSTAIYAVGHVSLSSVPVDHQLVAFWAPFLLLHLGGPDNITAYSLEDSKLWLRHLLNLVVQVLGVAYVLYKYVAGGDSFILLAAVLMFGVGVLKYAERTLALKRSNLDSIRSSVEKQVMEEGDMDIKKEEDNYSAMWTLMEMELSLMQVSSTLCLAGYAIRVASSLAAAASLMLVKFSNKGGHSTVDVAVSYTLLVGAFVLEAASLLRALVSTWTHGFLCNTRWSWLQYAALCTGRWDRLRWLVKAITGRGGEKQTSARRWSGKIGQHNILHVCSRQNRAYDPLLGKIARMLGYEDWWIRPEAAHVQIHKAPDLKVGTEHAGCDTKELGSRGVPGSWEMDLYNSLYDANLLGVEFQEGIIIWHIATEVFIAESRGPGTEDSGGLVKTIRTLSNYIIFLLVDRPYMLLGLAHRMLYRQTCDNLADIQQHSSGNLKRGMCTKLKDFFRLHDGPRAGGKHVEDLAKTLYKEKPTPTLAVPRLYFSYLVARKLIRRIEETGRVAMLKLLRDVWIDFLVYAANRCSRESHAKRLGNGGELTTILWLMTDYLHLQANNAAQDRH